MRLGWRRQALLVFVCAFGVRFGYLAATHQLTKPPPPFREQVRMARYLVHGTGFVSPVGPERDDPSSWYAPGYVAGLAGVFAVFGEESATALAVARILGLLAVSGAAALAVVVGRRLLGRRAAALAALLLIFTPSITSVAAELWDTLFITVGGMLCLTLFVFGRLEQRWRQFLAGAVCGGVALINPCFTTCYPIWVLWNRTWRRPGEWVKPRLGLHSATVLAGFILVILPWTIRNRVTFGEWFYLRGNLGLELWVANAPWSDGSIFAEDGRRIHPVFDDAEAARLVTGGEYNYFNDCMAEAKTVFATDPERVLRLSLRRIRWFWLGNYSERFSRVRLILKFIGFAVPGVLGLAGAVLVLRRRRRFWLLPAMLLIFPLPYYFTIPMVRYRIPLEPIVLLLTAFVLSEMVGAIRRRRSTQRNSH